METAKGIKADFQPDFLQSSKLLLENLLSKSRIYYMASSWSIYLPHNPSNDMQFDSLITQTFVALTSTPYCNPFLSVFQFLSVCRHTQPCTLKRYRVQSRGAYKNKGLLMPLPCGGQEPTTDISNFSKEYDSRQGVNGNKSDYANPDQLSTRKIHSHQAPFWFETDCTSICDFGNISTSKIHFILSGHSSCYPFQGACP